MDGRATSWRRQVAARHSSPPTTSASLGAAASLNPVACRVLCLGSSPWARRDINCRDFESYLISQQGISMSDNSTRARWGQRPPQLSSCWPPPKRARGRASRGRLWSPAGQVVVSTALP